MPHASATFAEMALDGEQAQEIQKVEATIRRRLGVGMSAPYTRLYNELLRQVARPSPCPACMLDPQFFFLK